MYAIIGDWPVDAEPDPQQLAHIADVVRRERGFVQGYWGQEPGDTSTAHAVVVFADEDSARRMVAGVTQAIPAASFRLLKVLAEAHRDATAPGATAGQG